MKKTILITAILMLSACTPVDKSESAEEFEKICSNATNLQVTWYSSNGHFSITCTVAQEDLNHDH